MKLNIPKVYVIHYTKLEDRKEKIIEQFSNFANLEFVNEYDKDELTTEILNSFYYPSSDEWIKKVSLWSPQVHNFRVLNPAEISCTIKHILAIKKVAENGDAFIIEDDLLLKEHFIEDFNSMISDLPNDWDLIMVGSGCNLHADNITNDKKFYKAKNPATRCLDSYLISQKAAQKIIDTIIPFQLVSDWEVAYHIYLHNLTTYWLEPSPCFQGSESGTYKSTLR